MKEPVQIAIFDVCDTLYGENTTLGFVQFFHGDRTWFKALDFIFTSRGSPVFYVLAIIYRLTGLDLPRAATLASLRGYSREILSNAAGNYLKTRLASIAIPQTQNRLREHQRMGDRVVLISNSLDIVVAEIGKAMNAEWHASPLSFDGNRCLGRTSRNLAGRKCDIARSLLAEHGGTVKLAVYTDNLSDRELVEAADSPVIVIPPNQSREAWGGFQAEFIKL